MLFIVIIDLMLVLANLQIIFVSLRIFTKKDMNKDIICIGHITKDRIVTPEMDIYMPGGTTFYFTNGIRHLDMKKVNYRLIASLGKEEMNVVEEMRANGIEVDVVPSRESVFFENIYGQNMNDRRQRVRAKADPFTIEKLEGLFPNRPTDSYIVLGSLMADDFSLDVVRYLSTLGTLVVDAQGYLREVRGEEVFASDWKDKHEALKYIDILKVNEHEAEVLTGEKDYRRACLQLAEWGVKEVLLTLGSHGSMILAEGEFFDIPAYKPKKEVDATGCGDTYVMGYLYKRAQGATVEQAGHFASAIAGKKLEASGPFCGTEEQIRLMVNG